jgi:hypothetical protein
VGRKKFSKEEIMEAESDILRTIGFRVACPSNLYLEASKLFKESLLTSSYYLQHSLKPSVLLSSYILFADRYLLFLSVLLTMSTEVKATVSEMAPIIAFLTLKVLKRHIKEQVCNGTLTKS